jgi:type II restriction endonuclease, Alw26I/Eco31I/Esp3I family
LAKETRNWSHRFLAYMDMIVNHPNYKGLPIKKKADGSLSWITTAKTKTGKERIEWCLEKADELGIPRRVGVYADVMLAIHPTKWKVCQTCGKEMSLYYHYPNANFVKALNKEFQAEFTNCDHIADIWDFLIQSGVRQTEIADFLISKSGLDLDPSIASKDEIIDALELICRKGNKKLLGPGAMSNFPDRFDGFHTYNRCCRSSQDKGRSKENLKSYLKDRRAYEYWSDGNIHAANQFMGSPFFDGISADHIGPVSLGFIHDPRYLQPMPVGDNSAKRDRLLAEDIEKIMEIYHRTGVYPMSWYSKLIWEFISENYKSHAEIVATVYRDALKQNMTNFMYILWSILENCPAIGEDFLEQKLLAQHYECFHYSYEFNTNGEIISQHPRHFTDRNQKEMERYKRIAIESVYDYNSKNNRHTKNDFTDYELSILSSLCRELNSQTNYDDCYHMLVSLVETMEHRIIASL